MLCNAIETNKLINNIKSEFSLVENLYYTTLRCFTIKGKEILRTGKISGASYHKKKEQIIIDIVSIFKNTSRK